MKIHKKMLMPPHSHTCLFTRKPCCVLDTVTGMLALKNIFHAQTERQWGVQSWCAVMLVVMRLKWVGIFSCFPNLLTPFSESNSSQKGNVVPRKKKGRWKCPPSLSLSFSITSFPAKYSWAHSLALPFPCLLLSYSHTLFHTLILLLSSLTCLSPLLPWHLDVFLFNWDAFQCGAN